MLLLIVQLEGSEPTAASSSAFNNIDSMSFDKVNRWIGTLMKCSIVHLFFVFCNHHPGQPQNDSALWSQHSRYLHHLLRHGGRSAAKIIIVLYYYFFCFVFFRRHI